MSSSKSLDWIDKLLILICLKADADCNKYTHVKQAETTFLRKGAVFDSDLNESSQSWASEENLGGMSVSIMYVGSLIYLLR